MATWSFDTRVKRDRSGETWRDWLAPGEDEPTMLIRRDDLSTRAYALGYDAHIETLRLWERTGILPRPIRRWDDRYGAVVALYPDWTLALIVAIRDAQRRGLSNAQVRDMMQQQFRGTLGQRTGADAWRDERCPCCQGMGVVRKPLNG